MLKLSAALIASALFLSANAQVAEYGQCGGIGYTGSTTCVSPYVCTYSNAYFSQCLPGTATGTTSTTSKVATTVGTTSKASTMATSATTTASSPAATGYVKTSGQKFTLNGSTYTVVGANAYWVGLMGYSVADMNKAFADIAATGATTVRTLGFNEETVASGDYYQLWTNGVPTVNTGATGLENFGKPISGARFHNVVATAKANGLRLIVTLTNNWSDYGGMDVYTAQLVGSGQAHDVFYTNAKTQAAYKNYVKTFVTRYINEPTILAWELANEPRCGGSSTVISVASSTCNAATITTWATTMSAYIKTIDSNHLVGLGDEGFINNSTSPDYPYQGNGIGIDFAANLAISSLDFGTFHMYPENWGESSNPNATAWGSAWIANHAAIQKSVGKPTIMEEFGVTTTDKVAVYTAWYAEVESSGISGALVWQAGSNLSVGVTPDDDYAVYPGTDVYTLTTSAAAALKARG
ncbi:glycoside hydrolase family 5 protein [Athelia psychrophila]|uniref:mannan endo-1,4-beta-mannosidase n=1 Tax=Athelia psychrophila TaxID=1759441 RepID=A0A166K9N6_9AGAM|nr:glycoside hydrolase family 5 protein [Fibularhizoctonia sp. CBS 109695]